MHITDSEVIACETPWFGISFAKEAEETSEGAVPTVHECDGGCEENNDEEPCCEGVADGKC